MSTKAFLAFALISGSANLFAQANATSTLQGTVYDVSKAVVPNASVTLSSTATGLRREEVSNGNGLYTFTLVPAGIYNVTVKAPGFTTSIVEKYELLVATSAALDVTLTTGAQSDLVTVDAAAPLIDVNKTEVSQSITPKEVQNLPINGRDFANLAFLAPGAKPVNSYDPTKNRIAVFGVNGSNGRNVNVTVNGVDDKDNTVGGPVMQLPLEAVQEFNISTQRFSAANGRSEGAALNLITKSGENQLHGSLFLFERDTSLNANDELSKQAGSDTAPYSRQQYGGSFGAPIVKDKAFAFFAIERQRESSNVVVNGNAYQDLVLAIPLGAQPAKTLPTPYDDQRYTGRFDYRLSEKNSFFATYNSQHNSGLNDQAAATNDLTAGNFTTNRLILANATLNTILSPSVVNSFTFGYQYWNNLIDSNNKVPYVSFGSDAQFGTNPNVPQQSYQSKFQFRDDLSINRGKHSFKMGFDFVNEPKLGGFFSTPSTPNVTFFDTPIDIFGIKKALYPQGFATPGAITSITASSGNSYFSSADAKMLGVYFQDDWKITKRLNLNLGVRWDRDFNLTGGSTQALGRTYQELKAINSPYTNGVPKDANLDFSPRVGFAYDLKGNGKYVIRGGYGIYFGQIFQNIPLFTEQQEGSTVFSQVLNLSNASAPGQAPDPNADIVPGTNIPLSKYRYGVDPFPVIPAATYALAPGSTGRLVSPDYRNPYNQEFNLGIAWSLTPNDVITFEGIHSLAVHESKRININPVNYLTGTRPLAAAFAAAAQPQLAQIIVEASIGRSRYDAFNVTYARRLTRRFTINANYVLSRALSYVGGPANFGGAAQDPNNIFARGDYGPAPNDETHRFVFSGQVSLPFGIQVAPIFQAATGRPWNPVQGVNVFGTGGGNSAWRAIVPTNGLTVGTPVGGGGTNYSAYTATAGFSNAQLRAGIANGTLVTVPYDNVRGNAFVQLDLRVSKVFTIRERHRIEVLCQVFDLNNRANYGNNYNNSIRSTAFGTPAGYLSTSGTIVPHSLEGEVGFQYRF